MFNLVVLTGRLTADPELKTTPSGLSVTSFSIAVERKYKSGEEKQTDFINIVAWRQTAEFVTHYFTKGSMIGIEGSIQTRKYQDREGNNRIVFEVVANNVQFVGGKQQNSETTEQEAAASNSPNETSTGFTEADNLDDDLPF